MLYKSNRTDSQGNQKTDLTIHRGKPITFQVDLTDQQNNSTLNVSGSGTVTLWERRTHLGGPGLFKFSA
jgi:hypothetical protein